MASGTYIPSANVPMLGQTNDIKSSVGNINLHSSNTLYYKNNIVMGTGHSVNGSNCFISGTNHIVNGNNILILGGDAITITDNNLLIFGDDVLFSATASFDAPIYGLPYQNIFTQLAPITVVSGTLISITISSILMNNIGDSILFNFFLINPGSNTYTFKYGGITFSTIGVGSGTSPGNIQARLYNTDGISSFMIQPIIGSSFLSFGTFSGINYSIDNNLIITSSNTSTSEVSSITSIKAPY